MDINLKLPIKVGNQSDYDAAVKQDNIIYICRDTGNMYVGTAKLGGSNLIFNETSNLTEDFGYEGAYCITPYGIYIKKDGTWNVFSNWEIRDNQLYINGKLPIATLEYAGMVKSSNEAGTIFVDYDGTMHLNGWDAVKDVNHIYRYNV